MLDVTAVNRSKARLRTSNWQCEIFWIS